MRFIIGFILSVIFFQSCKTNEVAKVSNIESETQQFIGTWEGEETEQFGIKKTWIQNRYEDGRYEITIRIPSLGAEGIIKESGKWWLQDGMFYEKNDQSMKAPDVYKYDFISEDEIKFISTSMDSTSGIEQYSFIDKRKK